MKNLSSFRSLSTYITVVAVVVLLTSTLLANTGSSKIILGWFSSWHTGRWSLDLLAGRAVSWVCSARSMLKSPDPQESTSRLRTKQNNKDLARDELLSSSSTLMLEDFSSPQHSWKVLNDPVMGGRSHATFTVTEGTAAVFEGYVAIVPFLRAPGFVQAVSTSSSFPDVSNCQAMQLQLRTKNETYYGGYRMSFGKDRAPHGKFYARGYKADFAVAPSSDFANITLPFRSFTDYWDDATGDAIVTCAENPAYCPTQHALQYLDNLAIWGEGVEGNIYLEVRSIQAIGCASS